MSRMNGVELLNKRVVTSGIELGRVVDVIFDETGENAIGLDVRCKDGENRFLPMATADLGDGDVLVDSPLVLLEPDQLDFYRAKGRALRSPK
jgi:sporulation protein YlmC with PRC-barrel domain